MTILTSLVLKNGTNIAVQIRILSYKDSEIIKENWRFCSNWLYGGLITPIDINKNEMFHLFSLYWILFWNFILVKRFAGINDKKWSK